MVRFEQAGVNKALEIRDSIKENSIGKTEVVINAKAIEVYRLYCGSRNCAGRETSSDKIIYFPQSNGFEYEE